MNPGHNQFANYSRNLIETPFESLADRARLKRPAERRLDVRRKVIRVYRLVESSGALVNKIRLTAYCAGERRTP